MTERERMEAKLASITRREIFARARGMLAQKHRRDPNWVVAMELFGLGSTFAWGICLEMGIDPDATTASIWPETKGAAA